MYQTIVQNYLDFILNLIAVMSQLLEMNIFVQLLILVEKMKEIVIQKMNVKIVLLVEQTIVQLHLVSTLKLTVAIHALVPVVILTGKVI